MTELSRTRSDEPTRPELANPEAPTRLGHYVIEKELGRGGFGVVYLATDEQLHRKVALKVLPLGAGADPEALLRFRREAEVASRLTHPGICSVYEAGHNDQLAWIALRYVEGRTLAELLKEQREKEGAADFLIQVGVRPNAEPKSQSGHHRTGSTGSVINERIRWIEKAARAVHSAHEAGVIHRDLKPANLMITPEGEPIVLDFGLARDEQSDAPTITRSGDLFGTPAYLAPEQLRQGQSSPDPRTDVWALGVSLYEAVALRRPFEAASRDALYRLILTSEPEDVREWNRHAPTDLSVVLATALEKDLGRRYQSAAAFADDLARVIAREPILARPASALTRFVRFVQRRPALATALAALVIVGAALVALVTRHLATRDQVAALERAQLEDRLESLLADGFLNFHAGSPAKAKTFFDEAVAIVPDSVEALTGLALLHLRDGAPARGLAAIDAAFRNRSPPPELDPLRALLRHEENPRLPLEPPGIPTTALGGYLHALLLANAAERAGTQLPAEAVTAATRAVASATHRRLVYHLLWARVAGQAADASAGALVASILRAEWPGHFSAHFLAGYAEMETAPERALDAFRAASALRPDEGTVKSNWAYCLVQLGRPREAEELLTEALKLHTPDESLWSNLGFARARQGRFAESLEAYEEARRLAPDDPEVLRNIAYSLRDLGKKDECLAFLREQCERIGKSVNLWIEFGRVALDLGAFEPAESAFTRAIALDASIAAAWTGRADARLELGRAEDALADATEGHRLAPTHYSAGRVRGRILRHLGRHREAIAILSALGEAGRTNARNLTDWGTSLFSIGRPHEGKDLLTRACALDPAMKECRVGLILALMQVGMIADAQRELASAQRLHPDDESWRESFDRLAPLLEQQSEVFAMLADPEILSQEDLPSQAMMVLASSAHHRGSTDLSIELGRRALDDPEFQTTADYCLLVGAVGSSLADSILTHTDPSEQSRRSTELQAWLTPALTRLESTPADSTRQTILDSWLLSPSLSAWRSLSSLPPSVSSQRDSLWSRIQSLSTP